MKKLSSLLFICLLAGFIEAQTPEIIKTDSSVIEIEVYPGGKQVREKMNGNNLIYHKFYYRKTNIVISIGTYDTTEHRTGFWQEFDTSGAPLYTCDYDKRNWKPINNEIYPYFNFLCGIKEKGDSIIRKTYGDNFFSKHVLWNFDASAVYGPESNYFSKSCTEPFEKKPDRFLLRYDIKLVDGYLAEERIAFELDTNGSFIGNSYPAVYGFEELQNSADNEFDITLQDAIDKSKLHGLVETDTSKAIAFLNWISFKSKNFYNGKFLLYVIQKNRSEERKIENSETLVITDHYDVWIFSPWTGEFIEKKKMHSIEYVEKYGGYRSGLIEDK